MIDTHCHLSDPAFAPDREAVLERMRAAQVDHALVIESDLRQLASTLAWAEPIPGLAVATACHPHDAGRWDASMRERLFDAWRHPCVRAVGEIGLDYHYDHAPRPVQQQVFAEQLDIAAAAGLPVVVHAREADADVVAILRGQPAATIVLHSFSSTAILRDAGLDAGWYFSFSGMITFKSWTQHDTLRLVPADRLLVETDAPYLAPVPYRGRRNEPAFLPQTVRALANARGATLDEVAARTSENATRLFWSRLPAGG
jgi:TatD DNase family protein